MGALRAKSPATPDGAALPVTPLVASLPATIPFVGPEAQERSRGAPFKARLGANEGPFGPSPAAVAAMAAAAPDVWRYGDPENHDLIEALAAHHGVLKGRITVGEGIDGILQNVVRIFVPEGASVVAAHGSYPTFLYHVNGFGGRPVLVPYADDHEDLDQLSAAARRTGAPLVYVVNPDNPMGTWHDASRIEAFLHSLPNGTVAAIDEAYAEFAPTGALLPDDYEHPRLLRLRTFSKAHGMAGARVGYVITTAEIAALFERVRNHFGMNRIGQVGALAALGDQAHLARVVNDVASAKARLSAIGHANGLEALPSATNFVTLDTRGDGAFSRALVAALAHHGVFVRMPFVSPGDRCIRISAGPPALLDAVAAALPLALRDARSSTQQLG